MSGLTKTVIAVSILSVCATLPSCTSETGPDTHLQQEVDRLQKRTVPPDARLIHQHLPAIQGWVARADWEFQTNYQADAYNEWLADRLRPDFQIHQDVGSPTQFSKYDHGDVEILSVATTSSAGMLRVAVQLVVYPD